MLGAFMGFVLLIATPAFADDEIDCPKAEAQQEMNFCTNKDFETADAELNAVWKKAKASAEQMDVGQPDDKGAADSLLAAQRGWIAYRDGICDLAGWEARGGSLEPMLVSGCLAEQTRKRTKELQEFVDGPAQ